MARINVNHWCNVCTDEHANGYISPDGKVAPQITVPHVRLRMSVQEAEELGKAILEAVEKAKALA